ncbi:protein gp37 [Bosea sp. OAE752]
MGMADRFKDVYRGRKWAGAPAEAMTRRVNGKAVWTGQLTLAPDHILMEPLRRRKPTTYFVNSMGDLFHEDTPEEWIDRVVAVMALAELLHLCPPGADGRDKHIFQLLTKRAERMRSYLDRLPNRDDIIADEADRIMGGKLPVELLVAVKRLVRMPLPNVWLGVSAEDQKRADERVPELLATPAAIRFVSAEPLLGPIDFEGIRYPDGLRLDALSGLHFDSEGVVDGVYGNPDHKLDWIIVGGESGPGARPMHPAWARSIRDQCAAAGTAFFFKQWGEWLPGEANRGQLDERPLFAYRRCDNHGYDWPEMHRLPASAVHNFGTHRDPWSGDLTSRRVGKKAAGRLLDGAEHNAMPEARR